MKYNMNESIIKLSEISGNIGNVEIWRKRVVSILEDVKEAGRREVLDKINSFLDNWETAIITFKYEGLKPTREQLIEGTQENIIALREKLKQSSKGDSTQEMEE